MDDAQLLARTADNRRLFADVLDSLGEGHARDATLCTDWDVRTLAGQMGDHLVTGAQVEAELAVEHERLAGGGEQALDLGVVDEVVEPERTRGAVAHAVAEALGPVGGVAGWLTTAAISAAIGVVVGGVIALVLHQALKRLKPGAVH